MLVKLPKQDTEAESTRVPRREAGGMLREKRSPARLRSAAAQPARGLRRQDLTQNGLLGAFCPPIPPEGPVRPHPGGQRRKSGFLLRSAGGRAPLQTLPAPPACASCPPCRQGHPSSLGITALLPWASLFPGHHHPSSPGIALPRASSLFPGQPIRCSNAEPALSRETGSWHCDPLFYKNTGGPRPP